MTKGIGGDDNNISSSHTYIQSVETFFIPTTSAVALPFIFHATIIGSLIKSWSHLLIAMQGLGKIFE